MISHDIRVKILSLKHSIVYLVILYHSYSREAFMFNWSKLLNHCSSFGLIEDLEWRLSSYKAFWLPESAVQSLAESKRWKEHIIKASFALGMSENFQFLWFISTGKLLSRLNTWAVVFKCLLTSESQTCN